jgi:hypothetical protein
MVFVGGLQAPRLHREGFYLLLRRQTKCLVYHDADDSAFRLFHQSWQEDAASVLRESVTSLVACPTVPV